MKRILSSLALLCLAALPALAQNAPGSTEIAGFRHISVRHGLPSSEVYDIIQDSKGYLWMCTDAGVCRFNGFAFTSFTTNEGLTDNTVFRLIEDNRGRIWAQGFSGAVSYFENGKFNSVKANDSIVHVFNNGKSLPQNILAEPSGAIVLGGSKSNGSYRISPDDNFTRLEKLNPPLPDSTYRGVWTDGNGRAYTSAYDILPEKCDYVARFYHNGHRTDIRLDERLNQTHNCRAVLTEDNRVLYTYSHYIYEILPGGIVNTHDMGSLVVGLNFDHAGNLWVCRYFAGAVYYPGADLYAEPRLFFAEKTISCVCEDNEGGFWFSTVGDGVYYMPDIHFGYLSAPAVRTLVPMSRGRVLAGTEGTKILLLDPSGKDSLVNLSLPGYSNAAIEAIVSRGDTVLLSADDFIQLGPELEILSVKNVEAHAKIVCADKKGRTFFIANPFFYHFDENRKFLFREEADIRFTAAGYDNEGRLWLGSLKGLWLYRPGAKPLYCGDSLGIRSRVDVIAASPSGELWLATRGDGIYVLKGKTVRHFTEKDGLASNVCRTLCINPKGEIWIGTNRGISFVNSYDFESGKASFRNFNTTNGLLSDEVLVVLSHEGRVITGSAKGLCWIEENSLVRQPVQPPVYLTRILYGEDTVNPRITPSFDYSDNIIRIFVEGISFHDPEGIRYRYRLIGGSGEWITTANREISFSGLSPGEYRLEIFAVNGSGIQSHIPVVFSFTILSPFYRTWWFITSLVIILIAVVWLLAGTRARRMRRIAQEKADNERRMTELRLSALRAQMNPHFIFNAINSIQHFVLRNDSDHAYDYLSKFSKLIRLVLDQSQTEQIPLSDEIRILELYVEMEQLRFERPFRFQLEVDPDLLEDNVMVPGMLVQPYVENAIWHGLLPKKEGEAVVSVRFVKLSEEQMEIIIEDNGIGREEAMKSDKKDGRRSYGMLITEERLRANRYRNTLAQTVITVDDIKDEQGNATGTRICILLPIT